MQSRIDSPCSAAERVGFKVQVTEKGSGVNGILVATGS
jgi:hypothetical protein